MYPHGCKNLEIIYNDSAFSITELISLIHAKEITLNEKFPLSIADIMTKTEESFMEDRFLPLLKRRELNLKIERIKSSLSNNQINPIENQKKENKGSDWKSIFSILAAIITVILGVFSAFIKYKGDKEKEIELYKLMAEKPQANSEGERKAAIQDLKVALVKDGFIPNSINQWIYNDTCLVHDYLIKNKFRIAVDTYRYLNIGRFSFLLGTRFQGNFFLKC